MFLHYDHDALLIFISIGCLKNVLMSSALRYVTLVQQSANQYTTSVEWVSYCIIYIGTGTTTLGDPTTHIIDITIYIKLWLCTTKRDIYNDGLFFLTSSYLPPFLMYPDVLMHLFKDILLFFHLSLAFSATLFVSNTFPLFPNTIFIKWIPPRRNALSGTLLQLMTLESLYRFISRTLTGTPTTKCVQG